MEPWLPRSSETRPPLLLIMVYLIQTMFRLQRSTCVCVCFLLGAGRAEGMGVQSGLPFDEAVSGLGLFSDHQQE